MLRVERLAAACPNADTLACGVVEVSLMQLVLTMIFLNFTRQAYLYVQLGITAFNGARHNEAVDHFTAAVNACAVSSKSVIHYVYEDLVVVRRYDASENAFHVQLYALCSYLGGT